MFRLFLAIFDIKYILEYIRNRKVYIVAVILDTYKEHNQVGKRSSFGSVNPMRVPKGEQT